MSWKDFLENGQLRGLALEFTDTVSLEEGGAQLHDEAILWDGGGRGVRFQR